MIMLDGYVAKDRIQATRTSEVWVAVRTSDGHPVVLKRYRPTSGTARRVQRELAALRELAGPSIPRAVEVTEASDGSTILVQERVPGIPLYDWARSGTVEIAQWLQMARALAQVLARVHGARLIHCDVHPRNILVDPNTLQVHLIDLGTARRLGTNLSAREMEVSSTAIAVGALAYVSPEQTGRMNRGMDFRSDLYSLGATLYFGLTGSPPFEGDDPLALIHAHMARRPLHPSERRRDVPETLSRIVLKLLEKEPSERYQSAQGLAHDLDACAEQLETTGQIADDLILGRLEAKSSPRFPARLYGRAHELFALESAYERARRGNLQVVLVSGGPGTGKSALVEQLREPVAKTQGYLAMSRGELDRNSVPYATWSAAIESWVDQVLVERDERLGFWRHRLRSAMQNVAAALFPFVPSLQWVTGDVPAVPPLGPKGTRERLAHCVQSFLHAAATPEHPLIIVLEDLHWADAGSVRLLEALIVAGEPLPLLIVATFRAMLPAEEGACSESTGRSGSKEMDTLLECVRSTSAAAVELELRPIGIGAVASMLSDALCIPPERAARLAEHVVGRTGTNLQGVRHYLDYMHDRGWLMQTEQGWSWDEPSDSVADAPETIVSLLVSQLENLPDDERAVIELASYAGDEFDVELLLELQDSKRDELEIHLVALAQRGLLCASRHGFRFTHGQIRDAAQALMAPQERAHVHGQLAHHLLSRLSREERDERIFELVDHANRSRLFEEDSERMRIIELNRAAGLRALQAGDGATAHQYLTHAHSKLRDASPHEHPRLNFELLLECAESALHADDMNAARTAIDSIDERVLDPADFSRVARVRVQVMVAQNSLEECARFIRSALARLGLRWSLRPGPFHLLWTVGWVRWRLGRLSPTWLPEPDANPGLRLPILRLLDASAGVLVRSHSKMFVLSTCWTLNCILRYGYACPPSVALATYAAFIARTLWGARRAHRLAEIALEWRACDENQLDRARTDFVVYGILSPFARSRRAALAPLLDTASTLRDHGDPERAAYATVLAIVPRILAGDPIPSLHELICLLEQVGRRAGHREPQLLASCVRLLYREPSDSPPPSDRELENRVVDLQRSIGTETDIEDGSVSTILMMALCALGRFDLAFSESERVMHHTRSESFVWIVDHVFYRGLAAAVCISDHKGRERREMSRAARRAQAKLKRWAKDGPDFVHMHQLVSAELAWARGSPKIATELYHAGARRAAQQEFAHHAALAFDRLGQRLAHMGRTIEAASAIGKALEGYTAWGATTRCAQLRARSSPSVR